MNKLGLREAKAAFSAVVEAAERGEPTTITKNGRPAAVVVPIAQARRLYQIEPPSFASLLMAIPQSLLDERDPSPMRETDL